MPSHCGAGQRERPTDLRVDHESTPCNVDPRTTTRFSWRVETDERDVGQSGYRLVVGRDEDAVAAGEGDVWDGGVVDSSDSIGIQYGGAPLAADTTYYWSVKLRTGDDAETEWAPPASFTTAIRESDWRGDWIAHQPGEGDTNGWRSIWRPDGWDGTEWVQLDLGAVEDVASVTLVPMNPTTVLRTPDGRAVTKSWFDDPLEGFGFPNGYRIEVAETASFDEPTLLAEVEPAATGTGDAADEDDGGERTPHRRDPARHDGLDGRGRYLRVTAIRLHTLDADSHAFSSDGRKTVRHAKWQCFALAAVSATDSSGTELTADCDVSASSSVESDAWGRSQLVNGVDESRAVSSSPLLQTAFDLDPGVERARLHVAAVGYGEPYLNGERVGNGRLDPAWTDYEESVLYNSYDVADHLEEGENVLGLWLGRGWFSKDQSYWMGDGSPRARAYLQVRYDDGSTRTVATDETWAATEGPIVANDIYDGERYDARREQPGWASPGFDTTGWNRADVVVAPGGALRPQRIQSMDVVDMLDAEAVHDHPDGPIIDFGQNLTGWVEIVVEGAAEGDEITLEHAEALTDSGDLSTTDLRTAAATDTYVANGDGTERYEPRFTYHGFRYAQVSGYPGEFDPRNVTAKVVHTAMPKRGEFACSNPDLEQVQHNAVWGLRGNTHSIPEDCPQRDERLGWTGDAQISTRSLLFNFDATRFDEKWIRDHEDASSDMGYVGDVVPNKSHEDPADPTWSVTRIMVPWYLYLHDGDEAILHEQYEGMRAYLDYWHSVTEYGGILPDGYGKFGDWLAFENTDGRRGLPHDLFNTAFHYQVTDTFARIAEVIGNETDAANYRGRADSIRSAFNERFFDEDDAVYGPGTQSSYAVPLFMGLVPDGSVERVVENLVEKVHADGEKLQTGFLGTRPLIHTLSAHGHADLAYEIVSQPERPGWVYMAREGATTMWERWNSDESVGSGMNSLNHSPFTHVSEFFYEVLAGIRLGDTPVTDHVTVAPNLVDDLDWVEGSVGTPNGDLAVEWERSTGDGYELTVTVPWNTTATVRLPGAAGMAVSESDVSLVDASEGTPDGVHGVRHDDRDVTVDVGSGGYRFTVS